MEEAFEKIVHHIFNNWTALRLAVEHSMGGPNSRQTALDCADYMVKYCLYEPNVDVVNVQEALEDILDEEFETICEDGSTKEIATILCKFVEMLKNGNIEQCEIEYGKLPVMNVHWLKATNTQIQQPTTVVTDSSSDEDTHNELPMEEDGWTEVKTRRKR